MAQLFRGDWQKMQGGSPGRAAQLKDGLYWM
jgi:hypothetical protein